MVATCVIEHLTDGRALLLERLNARKQRLSPPASSLSREQAGGERGCACTMAWRCLDPPSTSDPANRDTPRRRFPLAEQRSYELPVGGASPQVANKTASVFANVSSLSPVTPSALPQLTVSQAYRCRFPQRFPFDGRENGERLGAAPGACALRHQCLWCCRRRYYRFIHAPRQ